MTPLQFVRCRGRSGPKAACLRRDVIAVQRGWDSSGTRLYEGQQTRSFGEARRCPALAREFTRCPDCFKRNCDTTSDFAPTIADDTFIEPLIPYRLELMNGQARQIRSSHGRWHSSPLGRRVQGRSTRARSVSGRYAQRQ